MPFKSTLGKTVGRLLRVGRTKDLSAQPTANNALSNQLNSSYVRQVYPTNYDPTAPFSASGGTKYSYNSKWIHVFTSPGELITTDGQTVLECFVVGGGGGGSGSLGGGGGGGGYRAVNTPTAIGQYGVQITVGAGAVADPTAPEGNKGSDSTISYKPTHPNPTLAGNNIIVASGGGRGRREGVPYTDSDGGSGGGGSRGTPDYAGASSVASPDGISPTAQGNSGGACPALYHGSGGGGGGTGNGGNGSGANGGTGGTGVQAPATFRDPTNTYGTSGPSGNFWFAGGGGGGGWVPTGGSPAAGGAGGGGTGNANGSTPPNQPAGTGTAGLVNTGGGGGGGCSNTPNVHATAGGSGIVMIAYPTSV